MNEEKSSEMEKLWIIIKNYKKSVKKIFIKPINIIDGKEYLKTVLQKVDGYISG